MLTDKEADKFVGGGNVPLDGDDNAPQRAQYREAVIAASAQHAQMLDSRPDHEVRQLPDHPVVVPPEDAQEGDTPAEPAQPASPPSRPWTL